MATGDLARDAILLSAEFLVFLEKGGTELVILAGPEAAGHCTDRATDGRTNE